MWFEIKLQVDLNLHSKVVWKLVWKTEKRFHFPFLASGPLTQFHANYFSPTSLPCPWPSKPPWPSFARPAASRRVAPFLSLCVADSPTPRLESLTRRAHRSASSSYFGSCPRRSLHCCRRRFESASATPCMACAPRLWPHKSRARAAPLSYLTLEQAFTLA